MKFGLDLRPAPEVGPDAFHQPEKPIQEPTKLSAFTKPPSATLSSVSVWVLLIMSFLGAMFRP